ncbi:MAG: Gfo/Idh/MocA family oxidoreductase [Calditrichaeota bacterium]|nr:Gfo/Idh/MocA family oxidoreductase [Calditrichota bacterium]
MKINLAQIGVGYWGRNLLRSFFRSEHIGTLTAVDSSSSARQWVQKEYPTIRLGSSFEAVLEDPSVQAVALATPANTHFALAKQALLAGKHLFVEKPLSLTVAEAKELVTLAEKNQRMLMVGHTFLYNAAVQTVKDYITGGMLGDIYYVYSQRLNLGRVRSDVNAMWNLAPHDVSILLYWFGQLPTRVSAKGNSFLQDGVEDVVFMNLDFPGGMSAHIHVSWLDPNKRRSITVVGSKKMVVYEDTSADAKIKIYDKGITKKNIGDSLGDYDNFGKFQLIQRAGDLLIPKINFVEPLRAETDHFLNSILTRQQPLTNGTHGLQVIRILEAAQHSLKSNNVPIEISEN